MKLGLVLGILCAVFVHTGVILFGGWLFLGDKKDQGRLQQVELISEQEAAAQREKEKKPEPEREKKEEIESETEPVPDAAELAHTLDDPVIHDAPALDAASLGAIEAALNGQAGAGGDFAEAMSFASGGRIGGLGKAGVQEQVAENAFSLAEIDQKPRAVFQTTPSYPSELRSKREEGVVSLIFVVGADGKVVDPRVEKPGNPAFDKAALDAVRRWKFEPALRGGQRVACRMRIPIRFQPNG